MAHYPIENAFGNRRFILALWVIIAATGWGGLVFLGLTLLERQPPAGFDLALLLAAGHRVAQGFSPYDPTHTYSTLRAIDLFYSYPPPVAQAFSIIADTPLGVVLSGWAIGATGGLIYITARLTRPIDSSVARTTIILPAFALAPYFYPYSLALLFGNFDAWFPFLYGLTLVAALEPKRDKGNTTRVAGGIAMGLAAVVKLHPASLMVWFFIRGLCHRRANLTEEKNEARADANRDPSRPGEWTTLLWAAGTIAAVVTVSLTAGGTDAWLQYFRLLRLGFGADTVNLYNVSPGSQLAILLNNPSIARPISIVTSCCAFALTGWIAYSQRDILVSLAWAVVASLVILPVTWYHYPVVVMPLAIAALAREKQKTSSKATAVLIAAALLIASLSIALPVAIWLTIALVLVAVHRTVKPAY